MAFPFNILVAEDEFIVNGIVHLALDLAEPIHQENLVPQQRNQVTRNENYYEVTIPRYTDFQFREHFRMSRPTFQIFQSTFFRCNLT